MRHGHVTSSLGSLGGKVGGKVDSRLSFEPLLSLLFVRERIRFSENLRFSPAPSISSSFGFTNYSLAKYHQSSCK